MSEHLERPNVSADLIWEVASELQNGQFFSPGADATVENNNAFLVKRRSGGGAQFSRDPFNLTNTNTRTVTALPHLLYLQGV